VYNRWYQCAEIPDIAGAVAGVIAVCYPAGCAKIELGGLGDF